MLSELNRDNEALQLVNNIEHLLLEISELEKQKKESHKILESINNDVPPDVDTLDSLNLRYLDGYALRARVLGLLTVAQNKLSEIRSDLRIDLNILENISTCPCCGGSGEKISHRYVRFDQKIDVVVSSKPCEHCNGSGRIELGNTVNRIIEKAKKEINS